VEAHLIKGFIGLLPVSVKLIVVGETESHSSPVSTVFEV
jgi:hypothetical protein